MDTLLKHFLLTVLPHVVHPAPNWLWPTVVWVCVRTNKRDCSLSISYTLHPNIDGFLTFASTTFRSPSEKKGTHVAPLSTEVEEGMLERR